MTDLPAGQPSDPRLSPFGPGDVRTGDFARIWLATGSTALGAQVAALAVPLLAVVTLHASPGQVGLLGAAAWLPFLLFALPVGVLVDRRRRRPLLVAAEVIRAGTMAVIIGLGAAHALSLAVLVALQLVVGCGTVLFEVAYQSLLPSVVARERLDLANSRLQATEATALVAGPGLGGLLVQLVGAASTLAVTAVGSLVSALILARVPEPARPPRERSAGHDLGAGFGLLRRDRVLSGLLVFSAISNPFAQWITVLFLVDAVRRLDLGSGQLGGVLAVGAGGTLLGAATAPAVSTRVGALRTIMVTATVDPLVLFVLPAAQPEWGIAVLVVALGAALGVNGYAVGLDTVVVTTIRQRRTPDDLRGRVNAATRAVSYGTIALGAALGGLSGDLFGTRRGLLLGVVGALSTIVWMLTWARRVGRLEDRWDVPLA